jgi:hypothetical protein
VEVENEEVEVGFEMTEICLQVCEQLIRKLAASPQLALELASQAIEDQPAASSQLD